MFTIYSGMRDAVIKLGKENNFDVDTTSNAEWFTEDTLKKYAAVMFLNTTDPDDTLFTISQKNEFQRYIEAGGDFVGMCMRLPMQAIIGDGITGWWALHLTVILRSSKRQ